MHEISAYLEWPPERVTRAFAELAELSLIRSVEPAPAEHRLVHPEVALTSLLNRSEEELLERQRQVTTMRMAVADLLADYQKTAQRVDAGEIQRFDGMDEIRRCIEGLSDACRFEVSVFATGGAQPQASLEAARPLDQAVLARGVRLRYVYLESVRNDAPTAAYARWLTERGGQVRTVPQLPPRMVIYDRRAALLPVDPDEADAGAILLRGAGIVTSLHALFEQVWERGTALGDGTRRDSEGLTAHERAVLGLLASGLTDEVIARKLGISVRTGRRTTAELATKLGARSRFQAGALAALRGWVVPDAAVTPEP
ncbi:helix-turn-helix domain-containing protein [Streptomyces xanthophaeus]|uniref:helix-turn-helix domain-containing protein n=1 Tax=Streptomyces xanthophaeus TaxID=67385 RepID=UPI0026485323|nr:helix-turn-helix transcriptional regulator [Streptomyces xanthophaeus]